MAWDLGERLHKIRTPTSAGPSFAAACELYREASYWALVSLADREASPQDYGALWDGTDPERLLRSGGTSEKVALWRNLLVESSFVALAGQSHAEQAETAKELRSLARALLSTLEDPFDLVDTLLYQRLWRVASLTLVVAAGLALGIYQLNHYVRIGRDLAHGQPWRTSSVHARCEPELKRCSGVEGTLIFFHTKEELAPWIEFDLRRKKRFSSVFVRNRTDCCVERASPLVIEVSDDQRNWTIVAEQPRHFLEWTAEFPPVEARWVRVRATARTFLHLESVRVYP